MNDIINSKEKNIQTENEKLIDLIQAKNANKNQGQVVNKNQGTQERTDFENKKQSQDTLPDINLPDINLPQDDQQGSNQQENGSLNNPPQSSTGKQDNNRIGGVSDDVQNYYDIQAMEYRENNYFRYWKIPVLSYSEIGEDGKKYYIIDQQMEIFDNQLTQIKQTLRNTYKITPKIKKHPRDQYGKLIQPYQSYLVDEVILKIFDIQNTWIKNYNLLPKGSVIYMMHPLDQADGTKAIIYGKYVLRFFGAYQYELLKNKNNSLIIPYELNKYVLMGDIVDKIGLTVKYNDINDFVNISSKLNDVQTKFPDEYQIYKNSTIQGTDHNHFKESLQKLTLNENQYGSKLYIVNDTIDLTKGNIFNRNFKPITNIKNNYDNKQGKNILIQPQAMNVYQPSIRPQIRYSYDNSINGLINSFNSDGTNKYYNDPSTEIYLNTNISLLHGKQDTKKKLNDWKYSFFMENLYEKCYMYVVVDYVNTNDGNIQHGSDQLQKSVFYTGGQK